LSQEIVPKSWNTDTFLVAKFEPTSGFSNSLADKYKAEEQCEINKESYLLAARAL
jgi:hypothetical protein